jgi:lysophospholipase L1-like esterase
MTIAWLLWAFLGGAFATDVKIVQLGDSYSSGVGAVATRHDYDTSIPECWRSSQGWGGQYAERLRAQNYNVTYVNGACSGAKSHDLLNANLASQKWGICPFQRKRNTEVFYNRTRFQLKCNKFAMPQINYVDPTTDLVLLTIGGNDALFAQLLSTCILGIPIREARNCLDILAEARSTQVNYTETIKEALVEIWYKMGESGKIVVFQYPHLIQNYSRIWDDPRSGLSIDGPQLVREFTIEGNHAYIVAAEELNTEMGVEFLTVYSKMMDVFANHEADPRKHSRNDDRWISEFEPPIGSVFHPNRRGHLEWGAAVALEGVFGVDLS